MEGGLYHQRRTVRADHHVLRSHEFPSHVPDNDELDILGRNSRTMDDNLYGRHGNTHQAARERNRTTTHTPPQILRLPSPRKTARKQPLPQTGEMYFRATIHRILRSTSERR